MKFPTDEQFNSLVFNPVSVDDVVALLKETTYLYFFEPYTDGAKNVGYCMYLKSGNNNYVLMIETSHEDSAKLRCRNSSEQSELDLYIALLTS